VFRGLIFREHNQKSLTQEQKLGHIVFPWLRKFPVAWLPIIKTLESSAITPKLVNFLMNI